MSQGMQAGFEHKTGVPRYGALIAVLWTLLLAYSVFWVQNAHKREALLLGKIEGSAIYDRDNLYHRWASRLGGIYVPVMGSQQPNPYLSHIPERDISFITGKRLTLMSPDSLTSQLFVMAREYGQSYRGHIMSLKPIKPDNMPDSFEKKALQAFANGVKEVGQIEDFAGKPYYRYVRPLFTEKSCLKCHATQGYSEGDVLGGFSLSIPLEPYYAMLNREMRGVYFNHLLIWLLGLGVIGFATYKLGQLTSTLYEKAIVLENEVDERQMAQESLQEQAVVLEEEIAERRQVEEVVRISEEKFSKAFDNAPIMMTISRIEDGTYLDVNMKFVESSGYSREETIGKTTDELGWLAPEQRQLLLREIQQHGRVSGIELSLHAKEGKNLTCVYFAERITVHGQQCLISLGLDVTEQKLMEDQLRQSQKMEIIGQLAGGVAHDFNNILTVIMGYCNLLEMDSTLDQRQREKVVHIADASEKASQLTRGLLTFSRKEIMEIKKCNLKDIVQHIQGFLIRVIGEDIQLKIISRDIPIVVNADAGQIEQVLINLATNARDAMPNGGLLSIETDIQYIDENFVHDHGYGVPGRYACVSVSDSGCGMDEYTCKKIFEPFFTTKEPGKGTGLGMAIAYGIVKQHNGFINVYSELGCGTTFRIYLPVFADKDVPQEELSATTIICGGTETVLVVEDNTSVSSLLKSILNNYGYQVILANNGQEAVDIFTANSDDIKLVLMDIIMPLKNGQQALREIRQLCPHIKAFYLSGYTADFLEDRGVNDEGIELIMKPIRPYELLCKIREMLDK